MPDLGSSPGTEMLQKSHGCSVAETAHPSGPISRTPCCRPFDKRTPELAPPGCVSNHAVSCRDGQPWEARLTCIRAAAAATLVLLVSSGGHAADDLLGCRGIADDQDRLACYDALAAPPVPPPSPTLSDADTQAIARRIAACWATDPMPTGEVDLMVRVQPNGELVPDSLQIVSGDGAVLNAAIQAVLNPRCQPWPKPASGWPAQAFPLKLDTGTMF